MISIRPLDRIRVLLVLTLAAMLAVQLLADGVLAGSLWEGPLRAAAPLGGLGVLVYMFVRRSGSAAAFTVTGRAFVTPSHLSRLMGFGLLLLSGRTAFGEWDGHGPGTTLLITISVVCATAVAVLIWRGSPALELRAEGIRLTGPGGADIPWESLTPGLPRRPKPSSWSLALTVARPDLLPERMRGRAFLPLGWDTHPHLVVDAIRWYVDHPEDRARIGTQAEHDRLVSALDRV
ncbi:hypothetical protein AB0B66_36765 [Catellatospora sp. NPDC049111]|uniref:hypothetical protein n=1 Tax=Catellatospora sp. NPDC049111 TaxID=3155271 RepID=UPI0033EDCDCE